MSTRQAEPGVSFDHGAQYFTARNPVFQAYLDSWCAAGIATQWPTDPPVVVLQRGQIVRVADSVRRYVGVPGMTAIGRHLAQDVPVSLEARVERVAVQENSISLFGANNLFWGEYDHLIVALPAPQAAELLSEVTELNQPLKAVSMRPCWAVLMTFAGAKRVEWAGAFVQDSPLSWIAWNHTKPGRNSSNATLVLHATPEWTIKHWETPPDVVGKRLEEAFWEASGGVREMPLAIQTHRWRYALPLPAENVAASQSLGYLRSATGRIVACGDWSCGGRVEGAFLSGLAAAGHVLRGRNRQRSPQTTPIQLTLF
jgi:predicted NAD/FAD-dependent oxidoreductase